MKNFSLSKKERLLKPFQFQAVYKQGLLKKNPFIWIYYHKNGLAFNRIGISVSNKKCPNLVMRNRIKRLIREAYRLNKQKFGSGRDIVFVLKQFPLEPEYAFLQQQISRIDP